MRVSKLIGQTTREAPADADSISHRLLIRAGYIRRLAAGIYTLLPLGHRAVANIANVLREEMDAIDGQEVTMPVVHPAELWRRTGRWDSAGEALVRFKDRGGSDMLLAMTHEEVVADIASHEVRSHRQLPATIYQIQTKFRDEPRARGGLIRAREFLMKDSYSLDCDAEGMREQYSRHLEAYRRIFSRLRLPVSVVLSDVGMMGGSGAHEFTYLTPIGEDTIILCTACDFAANREVAAATSATSCPTCGAALREERGVEVGNIFQLGTRYSVALEAFYEDKSGARRPVFMGSYGIGLGRTLACIAEEHNDEAGLMLPASVAPFDVVLISLGQDEVAERLNADLARSQLSVLFDDRDATPGVKFADADLRGIPTRITISNRSLKGGGVEVSRRRGTGAIVVPVEQAEALVREWRDRT